MRDNEPAWRRHHNQQVGLPDTEYCAYEQLAKDYAARGEPPPTALFLYCPCRKCNRIRL